MVEAAHQRLGARIFSFLYHLPDTYIFLVLSVTIIAVSILAIYIVKKTIPADLRYKDNPVIGNMSAFVSIIYGVLAGLTALYLINNINYTADAVEHEANAVANIYRDSLWLKKDFRETIHASIRRYLERVINIEWPEMKKGEPLSDSDESVIDDISAQLSTYPVTTRSELIIIRELLQDVKTLYDSRQQRIHMTFAALNPQIWIVIAMGTILTLAINFLFGMNFYMHIFVIVAAGLMATSMLYLLITLDKPFQGEFVIEPDAFVAILKHMDVLDVKHQAFLRAKSPAIKNKAMTIEDEIATQ